MSKDQAVWALGAMSGTSLDGVDAAMVQTDGTRIYGFGKSGYRAYSDGERAVLHAALGQRSGNAVSAASEIIVSAHAELLADFPEAEIVGFHGQTLLHNPAARETLQIGDGQALANRLQREVVWDFRSADVALGGQGAPLAPFFHFALAQLIGLAEPVAFLNIGGVANLTWLDPTKSGAEAEGACLAFDTGPGNAKIDDAIRARLGRAMDNDGALTKAGTVDGDVLEEMLKAAYFLRVPPKSLDRDDFSEWSQSVAHLSDADAIATLAAGTAGAIARGLEHCPRPPSQLLLCGGGRKNPGLVEMIEALAPCPVHSVEHYDLDGDMLEAQAFAYLAVRVAGGLATSAPGTTGVAAPVGGGKVSKPKF